MITIKQSLQGYTRISYKGEEIAKHYLSATTQGTREAFSIPEEISVTDWLHENYAEEIQKIDVAERLEYLRGELRAEQISYEELHELQTLAKYIDPSDVELLEAAGVPENHNR